MKKLFIFVVLSVIGIWLVRADTVVVKGKTFAEVTFFTLSEYSATKDVNTLKASLKIFTDKGFETSIVHNNYINEVIDSLFNQYKKDGGEAFLVTFFDTTSSKYYIVSFFGIQNNDYMYMLFETEFE